MKTTNEFTEYSKHLAQISNDFIEAANEKVKSVSISFKDRVISINPTPNFPGTDILLKSLAVAVKAESDYYLKQASSPEAIAAQKEQDDAAQKIIDDAAKAALNEQPNNS